MGSSIESASELSVDGIEVPEDIVENNGVIVAAQSQGTNLPLTHSWSFQEVLGARLLASVETKVLDKHWKHIDGMS